MLLAVPAATQNPSIETWERGEMWCLVAAPAATPNQIIDTRQKREKWCLVAAPASAPNQTINTREGEVMCCLKAATWNEISLTHWATDTFLMINDQTNSTPIERRVQLEDYLLPVAGWFIAVFGDVRIRYSTFYVEDPDPFISCQLIDPVRDSSPRF